MACSQIEEDQEFDTPLPDPGAPARRTPLSKSWSPAHDRVAADGAAQLVGTLQIKPWLLAMPTEQDIDLSRPAVGTGVPRQFASLALQLDDQELALWVVDVTRDGALRHVSAAVTNMPDASATFTITPNERVMGTITTPARLYRIVPISETEQAVYRLGRSPGVRAATNAAALAAVDEFGFDIYVTDSGTPHRGSDPGARLLVSEGGTSPCTIANIGQCITTESIILTMIFTDVRRAWKLATDATDPTLCCDRLGTKGKDNIEFIYDTTIIGPNGQPLVGIYDPNLETIQFGRPGPNDVSAARNADAVIHEMTHHFLHKVGGLATTDDFSRMLHEGMADAMVGAIAELRDPYTEWVGDPNAWIDLIGQGEKWVIGDGVSPLFGPAQRDARVSRQWSWIPSVLGNVANHDRFHLASLAISNFFYRVQSAHLATDARFIELILKTAQWLEDWNHTGAIDINDFYFSVKKALRPNETALANHIDAVFAQMGGSIPPPGQGPNPPGPSVPPVAPLAVDGFPVACDTGLAIHRAFWSPTANTSTYRTYVGPFENIFSSSVTAVYAWSNFTTDFRVRSCNGAGCSSQSIDSYFMNYNAVCGF